MKRELMKLVEEMRESINSQYWPRDDQMIDWADRIEAIAKAQGEAEPFGYLHNVSGRMPEFHYKKKSHEGMMPLYTAPPSPAADVLVEALRQCIGVIERADVSQGYCMCGDTIAAHTSAFDAGHEPCDMGDYYAAQALDAAAEALATYEKERTK